MRRLIYILLMTAAQAALAQPANPFEGAWTARYVTGGGPPAQVDVVIQGLGGSWNRLGGKAKSDKCVFNKSPIAIQSATADELVFVVQRSQALPGCTDISLSLQRIDDKTLRGQFGTGGAVELTR